MRNLSIAFFNIISSTLHSAAFKDILLKKDFDIIGIQENRLSSNILLDHLSIQGCNFIRDRNTDGGGGVFLHKIKYFIS